MKRALKSGCLVLVMLSATTMQAASYSDFISGSPTLQGPAGQLTFATVFAALSLSMWFGTRFAWRRNLSIKPCRVRISDHK